MTEEKKDSCCTPSGSGCCCCKGGKKFILGALVGILIFVGGFVFAKGCPFGGGKTCHMNGMEGQKMCPITGKSMESAVPAPVK